MDKTRRPQLMMRVDRRTYTIEPIPIPTWDDAEARWLVFEPDYKPEIHGLPHVVTRQFGANRCSCLADDCPHLRGLVALALIPPGIERTAHMGAH